MLIKHIITLWLGTVCFAASAQTVGKTDPATGIVGPSDSSSTKAGQQGGLAKETGTKAAAQGMQGAKVAPSANGMQGAKDMKAAKAMQGAAGMQKGAGNAIPGGTQRGGMAQEGGGAGEVVG